MKVIKSLFLISLALGISSSLPAQKKIEATQLVDPFNPGEAPQGSPARVVDETSGRVAEIRIYPEVLPKVVEDFVEQYTFAVKSMEGVADETLLTANSISLLVPTIIWGEGAPEREIRAPLRLVNVGAADGLALIAAAAGCTLEPIQSPPKNGDTQPPRIIGYSFVVQSAEDADSTDYHLEFADQMILASPPKGPQSEPEDLSGVGIALNRSGDKIFVDKVLPDTPAARSGAVKPGTPILRISNKSGEEVPVQGKELAEVVKLIRGEPNTSITLVLPSDEEPGKEKAVSLIREKLPVKKSDYSYVPKVVALEPAKEVSNFTYPAGSSRKRDDLRTTDMTVVNRPPHVGVYAIGSILRKGGNEEKLRELISAALELADLPEGQEPVLSVHSQSETLIVKGTTEEHDIISQVIQAWKENAEIP